MSNNLNIEFISSTRNKEQIILDKKYIYNYSHTDKKDNKIYKCSYYKTDNKCSSYIKLNRNRNITEFKDYHNHNISNKKAPRAKARSEIKKILKDNDNPFLVKGKNIYNQATNNLGMWIPQYQSLRTTIQRKINKSFPKEVKDWSEIPDNHEFYTTISGEPFLLSKEENFILFQSPSQSKIQIEYNDNIFCDATFYSAPNICYQLLITRVYAKEFHKYFTTSFALMRNKEQVTYEKLFNSLKNNISKYTENDNYKPKLFHCDFEIAMSNAFIKVFPSTKVKFCLWHLGRALEVNRKKYIKLEDKNENIISLYKCVLNLAYIDDEYVIKVFDHIKHINDNNNFAQFLKYFEDNYIKKFSIKSWNYFENIENTTNTCCESYNNKLSNYFDKKPTYFKLLYILRKEEDDIIKENYRLKNGIWNSKKKIVFGRADEKDIIVRFYEDNINELKQNNAEEGTIVGEWYKCLKRLAGR